jgi:hypothetical protein
MSHNLAMGWKQGQSRVQVLNGFGVCPKSAFIGAENSATSLKFQSRPRALRPRGENGIAEDCV